MIISDLCCADSDTNKVRQSLRALRVCLLRFPLPPALLVFPNLVSPSLRFLRLLFPDSCGLGCLSRFFFVRPAVLHCSCSCCSFLLNLSFCLDVGSKCHHHAKFMIPASIIPSQAAVATAAQAAAAKAVRNKRTTVIPPNIR